MAISRRVLAAGLVLVSLFTGCSLLTNLDGLSEPTPAGPDATPTDASSSDRVDRVSVEGGSDAVALGDALVPDATVFSDFFDDPTPLPRAWTVETGNVAVAARADAPSSPSVLASSLRMAAPAEAYLGKELSTPGKTAYRCSFKFLLAAFAGANSIVTARLGAADGYVRFEVFAGGWHLYGQSGALEIGGAVSRPMVGAWHDATLALAADGTASIQVDSDLVKKAFPALDTRTTSFKVGVITASAGSDGDLFHDDVVCTAE
jgi:hypothetical protein